MVNNFKYLNWIGTGILVSLAVITTSVVVAQDDTINPVTSTNWQELSKTVIDLPEGDTRPLVALAAIAGNAKGEMQGWDKQTGTQAGNAGGCCCHCY